MEEDSVGAMIEEQPPRAYTSVLHISSSLPSTINELLARMMDTDDEFELAEIYEAIENLEQMAVEYTEALVDEWRIATSYVKACQAEMQRLTNHELWLERRISRIERVVKIILDTVPEQKLTTPSYRATMKLNPPAVEVLDETTIPLAYKSSKIKLKKVPAEAVANILKLLPESLIDEVETSINKSSVSEALKNGASVKGATLIQTKRLEIK